MNALLIGAAVGAGALWLLPRDAEASSAPAADWGFGIPSAFTAIADEWGAVIEDAIGAGPGAGELFDMSNEQNVSAFLHVIRMAEHRRDEPLVYQTIFGGDLFFDMSDHPRRAVTRTFRNGKTVTSTAAGAYQILARTWDGVRGDLPDFTPASQDAAAVKLLRGRGALADVRAGRFGDAVRKCNREWASLPGSPYGQPVVSLDECFAWFQEAGGVIV